MVFSRIDLVSGFNQIRIRDKDIGNTAFNTQLGAFEWVGMPFGVCNAPSTLQRVVNNVREDQIRNFLSVYIDNILIFSKIFEEHQQHLDPVHKPLQQHQIFPCIDKSSIFQPRVLFCGYIMDKRDIHMDLEKIKVIRGWPAPTSVHEV